MPKSLVKGYARIIESGFLKRYKEKFFFIHENDIYIPRELITEYSYRDNLFVEIENEINVQHVKNVNRGLAFSVFSTALLIGGLTLIFPVVPSLGLGLIGGCVVGLAQSQYLEKLRQSKFDKLTFVFEFLELLALHDHNNNQFAELNKTTNKIRDDFIRLNSDYGRLLDTLKYEYPRLFKRHIADVEDNAKKEVGIVVDGTIGGKIN